MIWMSDHLGHCQWFNREWLRFCGQELKECLRVGRFSGIYDSDRQLAQEAFEQASVQRDPIEHEYRLRHHAGTYRWVLDRSSPRFSPDGEFIGYLGVCIDVTHQHEYRNQLREREMVMHQLHAINERERSFLSCGIHDGLLQDIIGVEMLLQGCDTFQQEKLAERLTKARSTLRSALMHGRKLIGALRPMILDEHGLVSAIHFYAAELENRSGLQTEIKDQLAQDIVSPVWGGNVFQIVQEAMNNVEAHADTDSASIQIAIVDDHLEVVVSDRGNGFDAGGLMDTFGLRLMRERAAIFQGTARVRSEVGAGTDVSIRMPLPVSLRTEHE